jgi:hypothetical protein
MVSYPFLYWSYYHFFGGYNARASLLSALLVGIPLLTIFLALFVAFGRPAISAFLAGLIFFTLNYYWSLNSAETSNYTLRQYGIDVFIDGAITPCGRALKALQALSNTLALAILAVGVSELAQKLTSKFQ